jgi:hypothetical protein
MMSEEEVYCMDCGYVYTPRNYLGKSRCIKCGSEDYASKDWECTHQHCSERCTIGDIEEVNEDEMVAKTRVKTTCSNVC